MPLLLIEPKAEVLDRYGSPKRFPHREILIANSEHGRLLLVVYTLRGEAIRIISGRQTTRKETRDYETGI